MLSMLCDCWISVGKRDHAERSELNFLVLRSSLIFHIIRRMHADASSLESWPTA